MSFNINYFLLLLIIKITLQKGLPDYIYQGFNTTEIKSIKGFLETVIDFNKSSIKCDPDQIDSYNFYGSIKNYSFNLKNNFGDFVRCQSKNFSYIYIVAIDSEENYNLIKENFLTYFSRLSFFNYYSISICIPNCYEIKEDLYLNLNQNITKYQYIVKNISQKIIDNDQNNKQENPLFIFNFLTIMISVSLCFFFSIFNSVEKLNNFFCTIKCCSKSSRMNNAYLNLNKSETSKKYEEKTISNELDVVSEFIVEEKFRWDLLYYHFADSFSIDKNFKRLFKDTSKSNKISSKYTNDNLVSFINGIKAISLCLMNISLVFWISILAPNNNVNSPILYNRILSNGVLFYFLYLSVYTFVISLPINGFLLAYKYNLYLRNNDSIGIFRNLFIFFFKQIHSYLIFAFMIIVTFCLDTTMIMIYDMNGPLVTFFQEYTHRVYLDIIYFFSLSINFYGHFNDSIQQIAPCQFFYIAVNEFFYFIISMIFLTLYSKFKNLIFYTLIIFYISGLTLKSYLFSKGDRDYKNFIGWDIFIWKFEYAFTLYTIGIIFGIFYFECFYNDLNKTFDSYDSSSHISYILEKEDTQYVTRNIMRYISKSKSSQNLLTILAICLIFTTVFLDLFYFKLYQVESFSELNLSAKIYISIEIDLLIISFSLLIFRLVVLNKTIIASFLEHKIWIPISRSFSIITYIQIPLIYFVVLNVNYAMRFSLVRVFFLCFSMVIFIYVVALFIMIFISVPLKVGIKKMFK